ncbi:peptidoglycan editing factor PgeF [Thermomicrobium sp. 4228-Ro]|uniref:peptidoglycan editing factor PgeF n=1 Tax=Thermomicrobium sp. 4228-Ro TaxID=2993937 RepID=UPI002248F193|nr:peptidoglycan editing factor PgeF [Thermomicrobium sp. 4228-Ro]MCX2726096.1 peptidoglycan editing factor PgeF [Thermomicrobium sp. 4228-Ro]
MSAIPYRSRVLSQLGIPHGFTRRDLQLPAAGATSWNIGYELALQNRRIWWARLRIPLSATVFPYQVHGDRVALVTRADAGCGAEVPETAIPDTDALIACEPGLAVAVQCADCVPMLVYAPDLPAVAAIHAGWRGTVRSIAARVVTLLGELGQRSQRLSVVFGPSIGPCCYEVGEEVIDAWLSIAPGDPPGALVRYGSSVHFDLWTANRYLLERLGVPSNRIEVAGVCTRCRASEWFSYRAHGPRTGAQAAVIALPKEATEDDADE